MKKNNKLLNILLILLIIYIIYLMRNLWGGVYSKIISILKPFIIGFALAYAFNPLLRFLKSKKIPKVVGVVLILLIILLLIFYIVINIVPVFTTELINLFHGIISFMNDISLKFNIDLTKVENNIMYIFNKISKDFANNLPSTGVNILNTSINFISNFIISMVAFVYFLLDMDKIRNKIEKYYFSKNKKSYKLLSDIDQNVTNYFKGLSINIVISFIEYTLLYKLIGHPNFLLLGIIAALTPLIPYFGGIIMNLIAFITASVVSTKLLVLSLIICLIFPQIDGYLIVPKIYGKTNKVPPLLTIFAVFAGGVLGGVLGIIIALPITIVLLTIYRTYDEEISEKIDNFKDNVFDKSGGDNDE